MVAGRDPRGEPEGTAGGDGGTSDREPTGPTDVFPITSGLAVASMVCGVLGVVTFGLSALLGLLLGLMALSRIRRSKGALLGRRLAAGGMIVSAVSLLLAVVLIVLLVKWLDPDRPMGIRAQCHRRLFGLNGAFVQYKGTVGRSPDRLEDLCPAFMPVLEPFFCPSEQPQKIDKSGFRSTYHYVGPLSSRASPDVMIVYERAGNHSGGRNALYLSGTIRWITEEDFPARLEASLELVKREWDEYSPEQRKAIEAFHNDRAAP